MSNRREIFVLSNPAEISATAAREFLSLAEKSVQDHGRFTVALSGGSTPKSLFRALVDETLRNRMPWDLVHFFWGDERHVPPDHAESNYRMAQEALLSCVPVPLANVHRIRSEEAEASVAADAYEAELRNFFHLQAQEFPRFDLALMGMGPDGHTASLFPGTKALHEMQRLAVSNWVGKFYTYRITMTIPVFNHAACVMFLVTGEDKATALKAVLEGPYEPGQLPAQFVRPTNGKLLWFIDRSAARLLEKVS